MKESTNDQNTLTLGIHYPGVEFKKKGCLVVMRLVLLPYVAPLSCGAFSQHQSPVVPYTFRN